MAICLHKLSVSVITVVVKFRCHRTTIQRHFERDVLSGSLESNDVSFATQATESECGNRKGKSRCCLERQNI